MIGGKGGITLDEHTTIPLRLEYAGPTRKPTQEELSLDVHWLTKDPPWDPATTNESLDNTLLVPLEYSNMLG